MSSYTVTRSIVTSARVDRVHPLVDDFRAWSAWSPWEDLDPGMRREFSGPESGEGAYYAWSGNGKVGEGNMMIVSSSLAAVEIRLVFLKPFKANNPTRFEFEPVDGGTRITWSMHGENKGIMRLLAPLLRITKAVAADFDRGLARLKAAAESAPEGA